MTQAARVGVDAREAAQLGGASERDAAKEGVAAAKQAALTGQPDIEMSYTDAVDEELPEGIAERRRGRRGRRNAYTPEALAMLAIGDNLSNTWMVPPSPVSMLAAGAPPHRRGGPRQISQRRRGRWLCGRNR